MNTEVLFSSKTDLHTTPDDLFLQLHHEFHFTLDAAADSTNKKCESYLGPGSALGEDALDLDWGFHAGSGAIWCNPPYGRGTSKWLERAYDAWVKGHTVVLLLPARPGTKWFQTYAFDEGVERRWIGGRLKFGNPGNQGNSAPFDSIILVFKHQEWKGPYRWRIG